MILFSLLPMAPELFLTAMTLILVFGRIVFPNFFTQKAHVFSLLFLAATFVLTFFFSRSHAFAMDGLFVTEPFALFGKALVLVAAFISLLMLRLWLRREGLERVGPIILVLLASIGALLTISANSFILLYLGLELQAIPLYLIASYRRTDQRSTKAGLTWFALGFLSSAMLLYGVSLIYAAAGTMRFDILTVLFPEGQVPKLAIFGMALVLAGLAFRVSAAPFHLGKSDIHEGAASPMTVFFATAPVIAAFMVLSRLLAGPFVEMAEYWRPILVVLAVLSLIIGGLGSLFEWNVKRLMTCLVVGVAGQVLLGLASSGEHGVSAAIVTLTTMLLAMIGCYAIILSMRVKGVAVTRLSDLSGLYRDHPAMAFCFSIFVLSLVGVPPLAGFWARLFLFSALVEHDMVGTAFLGMASYILLAFSGLRIVKTFYFDEPDDPLDRVGNTILFAIMTGAAGLIVFVAIFPQPLLGAASRAAGWLF